VSYKKRTGSYYTPQYLAEFMVDHILKNVSLSGEVNVLEPSVGEGSFLRAYSRLTIPKEIRKVSIHSVDKSKRAITQSKKSIEQFKLDRCQYRFLAQDFLKFQRGNDNKFSIIAGNPPFIKTSRLFKWQLEACSSIHKNAGLKNQRVRNIWPSFVIRCSDMLDDSGVLAFVLPSDLLQTNYSRELREFLFSKFQRIEIFTFRELIFECKGQHTIILFGFRSHESKGLYFTDITSKNELLKGEFQISQNTLLVQSETKWSHHSLASEDISFLNKLKTKLGRMQDYCSSKPGIVTAANNFFIIDRETEKRFELSKYSKAIIQNGFSVNGGVTFTGDDLKALVRSDKPSKVLNFPEQPITKFSAGVKRYLQQGVRDEINRGYKCSNRKKWFVIPNITKASDAFFFRRVHEYPKFLKNDAGVLVTDAAYVVDVHEQVDIETLIYSFYNSLTLTFAELNGRVYGGGVLELTPSEFKMLPIPYKVSPKIQFPDFCVSFKKKNNIGEILDVSDLNLLHAGLGLSAEEIVRVQTIRKGLVARRSG